jgi:hypothetical protein
MGGQQSTDDKGNTLCDIKPLQGKPIVVVPVFVNFLNGLNVLGFKNDSDVTIHNFKMHFEENIQTKDGVTPSICKHVAWILSTIVKQEKIAIENIGADNVTYEALKSLLTPNPKIQPSTSKTIKKFLWASQEINRSEGFYSLPNILHISPLKTNGAITAYAIVINLENGDFTTMNDKFSMMNIEANRQELTNAEFDEIKKYVKPTNSSSALKQMVFIPFNSNIKLKGNLDKQLMKLVFTAYKKHVSDMTNMLDVYDKNQAYKDLPTSDVTLELNTGDSPDTENFWKKVTSIPGGLVYFLETGNILTNKSKFLKYITIGGLGAGALAAGAYALRKKYIKKGADKDELESVIESLEAVRSELTGSKAAALDRAIKQLNKIANNGEEEEVASEDFDLPASDMVVESAPVESAGELPSVAVESAGELPSVESAALPSVVEESAPELPSVVVESEPEPESAPEESEQEETNLFTSEED